MLKVLICFILEISVLFLYSACIVSSKCSKIEENSKNDL